MSKIAEVVLGVTAPGATGDFALGMRLDGNSVSDGSQDLAMGAITMTTDGTANTIFKQSVDIPVKSGNTLNLKVASSVSAANCDVVAQVTFA